VNAEVLNLGLYASFPFASGDFLDISAELELAAA
jgi:hypothetical protein